MSENSATTPTALAKSRPVWRGWLWSCFALLLLFAGASAYLLHSTAGLRWLLQLPPQLVKVEGVEGRLLGPLRIAELQWQQADKQVLIRDLKLDWSPAALWSRHLLIKQLTLAELELISPASDEATLLPPHLKLPLSIELQQLSVGQFRLYQQVGTAPVFRAQQLQLALQSRDGQHQLSQLKLLSDYGELSGQLQLAEQRPFALTGQGQLLGQVQLGERGQQQAKLDFQLAGNLSQLLLELQASGAGLSGQVSAQLTPFEAVPLSQLELAINNFEPQFFYAAAPKAKLDLKAQLTGVSKHQLRGKLQLENHQPLAYNLGGIPLLSLRSDTQLSPEKLQFEHLSVLLPGQAELAGRFDWSPKQANGTADLAIRQLNPLLLDSRARAMRLQGHLRVAGDARQQQGELRLGDGRLALQVDFRHDQRALSLDKLLLTQQQASLSGRGKLALSGAYDFDFSGELAHFDLAALMQVPASDLNASLISSGKLQPQPSGNLALTIHQSQLFGQPIQGQAQATFTSPQQGQGELELRVGENRLAAKGQLAGDQSQLALLLQAPALQQLGLGYAGSVSAELNYTPAEAKLTAQAQQLKLPSGQSVAQLKLQGTLVGQQLQLQADAEQIQQGEQQFPHAQLVLSGREQDHQLHLELALADKQRLNARLQGALLNRQQGVPQLAWQGELSQLSLKGGALPVVLQQPAKLHYQNRRVDLQQLKLAVAGGMVDLQQLVWTPDSLSSKGRFSGIGLRTGLKPNLSESTEAALLRLAGDWDVLLMHQPSGHFSVRRESGDWLLPGETALALKLQQLQLRGDLEPGQLRLKAELVGEQIGRGSVDATLPLRREGAWWTLASQAALSAKARLQSRDLTWLGPTLNRNFRTAGELLLDATVAGTWAQPTIDGKLAGRDLEFAMLDQNLRLQQGVLTLNFNHDQVEVAQLNFKMPLAAPPKDKLLSNLKLDTSKPGELSVRGHLALSGEAGELQVEAERLAISQSSEHWLVVSGNTRAKLADKVLKVTGQVNADAGLIRPAVNQRPRLADDVVFSSVQPEKVKPQNIQIEATLDLGEQFYLRAAGLQARLGGQLTLRGAPGKLLRASGMISSADATFEAYGQKLAVERGIVNFDGPIHDPGLNIRAVRQGLAVEAGVEVTGTALQPSVALVSTPTVPDAEKLSWIVLGRVPDAAGLDSALLVAAAGSILGGSTGGFTHQLREGLGIDELSLRQASSKDSYGGSRNGDALSSQIITIGKRLSSKAFLSYEQGVTAVAGVTKLSYTLNPRVNIVTQAGVDNAIDVFYSFRFD